MGIFIWIAIIVIIILVVLYIVGKSADNENDYGLDDNRYREYVYKSVQSDFKPYLQQILNDIDTINSLRNKFETKK